MSPARNALRPGSTGGVAREAFALPLIFLTVALGGGFRVAPAGQGMRFLPPPLIAFVLAMLTVGAAARAGLLVPARLMRGDRDAAANLSGAMVLVTLFAATAQVFNTVTPESGLLNLTFNTFFVLLMWNTLAAGPDATRLLRSFWVVFGSAFAVKYIIIATLYDPHAGLGRRALTVLLEGVTLGTLSFQPDAPLTGYVAFFTVLLYMIGLALLPRDLPSLPALSVRASQDLVEAG